MVHRRQRASPSAFSEWKALAGRVKEGSIFQPEQNERVPSSEVAQDKYLFARSEDKGGSNATLGAATMSAHVLSPLSGRALW